MLLWMLLWVLMSPLSEIPVHKWNSDHAPVLLADTGGHLHHGPDPGPVHAWHGHRLKPVLNWAGPCLVWLGLGTGLSLFLIGPIHAWHGHRLKSVLNWAGPCLAWLGLGTGLSLFLIGPVHAWHGLGWARLNCS